MSEQHSSTEKKRERVSVRLNCHCVSTHTHTHSQSTSVWSSWLGCFRKQTFFDRPNDSDFEFSIEKPWKILFSLRTDTALEARNTLIELSSFRFHDSSRDSRTLFKCHLKAVADHNKYIIDVVVVVPRNIRLHALSIHPYLPPLRRH